MLDNISMLFDKHSFYSRDQERKDYFGQNMTAFESKLMKIIKVFALQKFMFNFSILL